MRRGFSKYGAKKAHCSIGHEHDSQREAKRCNELRLLERAGEISHFETQAQFWFEIAGKQLKHDNGRRVGVKLDFTYRDRSGNQVAEDSKGMIVRDWPLRKAVFRALYPHIELREV
jgi:hypothetical protein